MILEDCFSWIHFLRPHEGINLRGMFRFPVERYADKLLPSAAAEKTRASAS